MSQDELDELFGEEISEGSQIQMEVDNLAVSKLTDSEGEQEQELESLEDGDEEETITTEINELTLPSIQKPSSQGLIVNQKLHENVSLIII